MAGPTTIIDLPPRHEQSYFVCLEDWSSEMAEANDLKRDWYADARTHGLRVKLAVDADDRPLGMIQYLPVEESPVEGAGLFMILCIWVHGYDEGVGDHQRHGIGSALLEAAEADARSLGATGMAAWGLRIPVWMRASWFKKHGYRPADNQGVRQLVWKPFSPVAAPPRWVPSGPVPETETGRVTVTAFKNGWCPASNVVHERARRAAEELGAGVTFVSIDVTRKEDLVRFGHSDEVFIDGKSVQAGPPPSYEKIKKKIEKRLRRVEGR